MDDRTLIERAAKAAGLNIKGTLVNADDAFTGLIVGVKGTREKKPWNPLTDDGDALRLMVKLPVNVKFEGATESTFRVTAGDCREWAKFHDGDIDAATRRAIVRAAASLAMGE